MQPFDESIITRLKIGAVGAQDRVKVERLAFAPDQDISGKRISARDP